jgi:hypothetical protein
MSRLWSKRMPYLVAGIFLGLSLGLATTAGVVIGFRASDSPDTAANPIGAKFDEMKLHAMGAMGAETMAITTGPVDEEAEGVFFLDFLTGDLQCFVLNPRVGKFTGWFKTNVVKDLPVEKGKKPAYIICSGAWNPTRGGGNARPAQCVVYVCDTNTGAFAAYSFPWVRGTGSTLQTQASPMITLDGGRARTLELRE